MKRAVKKMNYFAILQILELLSVSYSEDIQHVKEENKETFVVDNHVEENKTDAVGISVLNSELSVKTLSEIHDLAKNISHSKGIYREIRDETMLDNGREIRRSMLKKTSIASGSSAVKNILEKIASDKNTLELLQEMEYLVHQYDVAVNFASIGGVNIVAPFLFSSDDEIASSAALVLGSAMQSNPTVQKLAMKMEVGKHLLNLLAHKSPDVLPRIIFALSSFLRNAPEAQEEFIVLNGIPKLVDILKDQHLATKTKLKIINLFSDLVMEQKIAALYLNDKNSEQIHAIRSFADEIQKYDVCKIIPSFLFLEDFDTHQKIAAAMMSLHDVCNDNFKNEVIYNRLRKLLKIYHPDAEKDSLCSVIDVELMKALHNELIALIKNIYEESSSKSTLKDDL